VKAYTVEFEGVCNTLLVNNTGAVAMLDCSDEWRYAA
jgi:hypothetical protein